MRIAVALSGGVDSTTVAYRLQQAGHEVFGLTMQLCPDLHDLPATAQSTAKAQPGLEAHGCTRCVAPCACVDGTKTARKLGMEHHILDLRDRFEELVITPFVQAFSRGLTPNPCALCNRAVKFGLLIDEAKKYGAEALATGHYACIRQDDGEPKIYRGNDPTKDQTYFLALVPQERLRFVQFPLCQSTKAEVEAQARTSGLMLERAETSNEICFLRELAHTDFLRRRIPEAFIPGDIVDVQGKVLGRHTGLPNYTIGQRRGIGVAAAHPLYVIRLEQETNRLVVGPDEALVARQVRVCELNWPGKKPVNPLAVHAMIRYRQQPEPAELTFVDEQQAVLTFRQTVRAVTPGQIAAIYADGRLLGGGCIAGIED